MAQPPTRIADAPNFIKGVVNLRGTIVPIVDMRLKFNCEKAEYNSFTVVIILNLRARIVGIVVDSVSDVMELPPESLKAAPDIDSVIDSRSCCTSRLASALRVTTFCGAGCSFLVCTFFGNLGLVDLRLHATFGKCQLVRCLAGGLFVFNLGTHGTAGFAVGTTTLLTGSTTATNGINISTGCFAIAGTCLAVGGAAARSDSADFPGRQFPLTVVLRDAGVRRRGGHPQVFNEEPLKAETARDAVGSGARIHDHAGGRRGSLERHAREKRDDLAR